MMASPVPRLVAWEVTQACELACVHCRAEAQPNPHPHQLSTEEGLRLIDEVASFGQPIILILTGGEPLWRPDIFALAAYGTYRGLRVVMAPCGPSLTPKVVKKIRESGIARVSISLDGSTAGIHDSFRQVPGVFEATIRGIGYCQAGGLGVQINTTVTQRNLQDLPDILKLVLDLGVEAWHPFMLVPTGRGKAIEGEAVSPQEYEAVLGWLAEVSGAGLEVKPTCAPHYVRLFRQSQKPRGGQGHALHSVSGGCLAGRGFVFVSHLGEVFGCGFLPVSAGNVRQAPFPDIYLHSPLFQELRDYRRLGGRCGYCEYRAVCGGCRARALAATGDYLAEEPYCIYQPRSAAKVEGHR